ncbi:hypothetical protein M5X06_22205 [Paenibacillus alvei]|uniref:Uncharacterized protein n=1 Tax=Paenibacillus alvei TaxID=44250 RepID=A0ABT4H2K2_PAEAL|nr:hypothetical protein [Paenibacillus alvei]MCY9763208.1 hypothetical protein [Paenibacillus alvei]MCY9769503.1 hypothetical protein [Paenibacillus alvei]
MENNYQELVSKLGGVIIQIDPKEGSYINPLEVVNSEITVKDFFDSYGNLKPFEIVTKTTGITLEMYKQAVSIIRVANGENTNDTECALEDTK